MKPSVYIFRGAPASGKGTVVPKFAKLLPKPIALIEQDKLRWGFHLIGRSVEEIGSDEHKLAFENTKLIYEQYLKSGKYAVVIEGLFTWNDAASDQGSATELLELAQRYGFVAKSIVLIADKATLQKRNFERPSYTTPNEEFDVLYNNIYGIIDESELVIDSMNQSPEETLTQLRNLLLM